jgi:hypothetical protein
LFDIISTTIAFEFSQYNRQFLSDILTLPLFDLSVKTEHLTGTKPDEEEPILTSHDAYATSSSGDGTDKRLPTTYNTDARNAVDAELNNNAHHNPPSTRNNKPEEHLTFDHPPPPSTPSAEPSNGTYVIVAVIGGLGAVLVTTVVACLVRVVVKRGRRRRVKGGGVMMGGAGVAGTLGMPSCKDPMLPVDKRAMIGMTVRYKI